MRGSLRMFSCGAALVGCSTLTALAENHRPSKKDLWTPTLHVEYSDDREMYTDSQTVQVFAVLSRSSEEELVEGLTVSQRFSIQHEVPGGSLDVVFEPDEQDSSRVHVSIVLREEDNGTAFSSGVDDVLQIMRSNTNNVSGDNDNDGEAKLSSGNDKVSEFSLTLSTNEREAAQQAASRAAGALLRAALDESSASMFESAWSSAAVWSIMLAYNRLHRVEVRHGPASIRFDLSNATVALPVLDALVAHERRLAKERMESSGSGSSPSSTSIAIGLVGLGLLSYSAVWAATAIGRGVVWTVDQFRT